MVRRLFPEPFKDTVSALNSLTSSDESITPVERIKILLGLGSSFLIDLAFLPPSLIESIITFKGK